MNIIPTLCTNEFGNFAEFPFYKNGIPVNGALWGITLKKAGSMRFRWDETNSLRRNTLHKIAEGRKIAQVELIHSKTVLEAPADGFPAGTQCDGILCVNKNLMPVITVADCVPIYFFDQKSGAFGVLHSGWKGTGIIAEAAEMLQSLYSAKPENILIAIGPHIRECCYIVDEERALYFANNFSEGCISEYAAHDKDSSRLKWKNNGTKQFHLSLEKANLSIIGKLNIPEGNITLLQDCTCCNEIYASNRRQTSKGEVFTVQAAFVKSGTAEKNVSF